MSGNPVSIQHQGYARLLSENTLQGTGTHRTSGRQAQTLQAYRTSMREDGAELRLVRRACSRHHLYQIRPHGLAFLCYLWPKHSSGGRLQPQREAGRQGSLVIGIQVKDLGRLWVKLVANLCELLCREIML